MSMDSEHVLRVEYYKPFLRHRFLFLFHTKFTSSMHYAGQTKIYRYVFALGKLYVYDYLIIKEIEGLGTRIPAGNA